MNNPIKRFTAVFCVLALIFALGTAALADEDAATAGAQEAAAATDTAADAGTGTATATPDNGVSDAGSSGTGTEETPSEDGGTETEELSAGDASSGDAEDGEEAGTGEGEDAEDGAEEEEDADAAAPEDEDGDTASVPRYAVSVPEGESSELYLTQLTSNTCTLASAAMLIRNYIYLNGSDLWQEIGEAGLRATAWADGLKESFTYSYGGYTFSVAQKSLSAPSVAELKALLDRHPEGIVLYCGNAPHAVLLLDYEDGVFYCADPAGLCSGKRIALADSWLSSYYQGQGTILANVTHYWYISSAVSPVEDSGITWTWNGSTLTISGEGALADDGAIGSAPWDRYKDYVTSIEIKEGVTNIPSFAFYNYAGVTAVTLPETVETIGARAFYGCERLESIQLPEGLNEIGQYAFAQCASLTSLSVPTGVRVIPKGLCYCCGSLVSLTLGEGAEELEASIIYGCNALTQIILPAGVTSIAAKAFQSCDSLRAVYYASEEALALLEDAVFSGDVVFCPVSELEDGSAQEDASEEPALSPEEAPAGEDASDESLWDENTLSGVDGDAVSPAIPFTDEAVLI